MREIVFRGKKTDNGEWVEGYLVKKIDPLLSIGKWFILTQEYDTNCIDGSPTTLKVEMTWYKINPETVGQYTGLTDKNGKRIFEGDILHFKTYQGGGFACPIGTDVYYRVLFGSCNPDMNTLTEYVGFWALGKNYDEDDLYEYGSSISYLVNSHGACVIGNIHDNPELLKEGATND